MKRQKALNGVSVPSAFFSASVFRRGVPFGDVDRPAFGAILGLELPQGVAIGCERACENGDAIAGLEFAQDFARHDVLVQT
jgi:hypothetical protein